MTDRRSDKGQAGFFSFRGACCLALVATFCCLIDLPVFAQETSGDSLPRKTETSMAAQTRRGGGSSSVEGDSGGAYRRD